MVPLFITTVLPAGRSAAAAAAADDQPVHRSAAEDVPLPLDRPGQHGRTHRRHRGVGERSEHHLRRLRGRRRVQVREQRHDVRRRCSRPTAPRRSATSPSIRPTPTSSTSAPARRTTARRRRSATASTRRPTAARPSRNIGLKETQTIARIVIDPKNPETVYVASPGHLFGPNPERGIYKTTDGGKTWNKIKFIDDDTGLHRHRDRSRRTRSILYAASYQRRRSGCCFNGGGPGSAHLEDDGRGQDLDEADAAPACRRAPTAASRSTSRDRTRTSSTRRSRPARSARRRPARGADPTRRPRATPAGAAAVTPPGAHGRRRRARAAARSAARPAAARGGGGGGAAATTGATTPGPARGFGRGGGGQRPPARSRPRSIRARRRLPLRRQGQDLDALSNCNARPMYFSQLRVDPRTTRRSTSRACPSRSRSTAARPSRRSTRRAATATRPRRSARDLDRSEEPEAHHDRQRRRSQHQLGPGQDVGLREHDGDGARLRRLRRHAASVLRLHRACRTTAAGAARARRAAANGILNSDWFGIGGGDGFQTAVDPTDFNRGSGARWHQRPLAATPRRRSRPRTDRAARCDRRSEAPGGRGQRLRAWRTQPEAAGEHGVDDDTVAVELEHDELATPGHGLQDLARERAASSAGVPRTTSVCGASEATIVRPARAAWKASVRMAISGSSGTRRRPLPRCGCSKVRGSMRGPFRGQRHETRKPTCDEGV